MNNVIDIKDKDIRKFGGRSLGIPREIMPQIATKHIMDFVQSLPVSSERVIMHVGDIKPTQDSYMMEKVLQKQEYFEEHINNLKVKTLIISNDNYLLDGHHNYMGLCKVNPDILVSVIRVDIPMTELLIRATLYKNATTQSYEESYETLRKERIKV